MLKELSGVMPTPVYVLFKRIQGIFRLPWIFMDAIRDEECQKPVSVIIADLLYIYFRLKYFPKDYLKCRLWERNRRELVYYYGSPSGLYARLRLRKSVQNREYQIIFDDKYLTYHYLKGLNIPQPETFGLLEAQDLQKSDIDALLTKLKRDEIIIKPTEGHHGRGVYLIRRKKSIIYVTNSGPEFEMGSFSLKELSLIQERVNQHPKISLIYPHSINTIRLHTLYTQEGDVLIFGTGMRFGRGGNVVDNVGAGGIAVGINNYSGITVSVGFDGPARKHYNHPDTMVNFCKFTIPHWKGIVEIATKIQKASYFYKLLGLDFAVSKTGPVIIEVNANPEMGYQELYTGPLLKNERIRREFDRYGLLYNKVKKN